MPVRLAKIADFQAIRQLAVRFARPCPGRGVDLAGAQKAARDRLAGLEALRMRAATRILVAEDGGQLAGFLLLSLESVEEATGQPQAQILELVAMNAVTRRELADEAARLAFRRGLGFIAWKIRAEELSEAQQAGFQLERCQIVMETP